MAILDRKGLQNLYFPWRGLYFCYGSAVHNRNNVPVYTA